MIKFVNEHRQYIGRQHWHFEETDSTNNRAAEQAIDPANAGLVITAGQQTQGRGQYGRVWQSGANANILMSVLVFPPLPLRHPAILTAFAAVVIAETVRTVTGEQATIKWPNDVLFRGQKLCGILIESGVFQHRHDSPQHFIIGIGLNVNQTAADFVACQLPTACSLAMIVGHPLSIEMMTNAVIDRMDAEYAQLIQGDVAPLEQTWKHLMGLQGLEVVVELMDGQTHLGRLIDAGFERVLLDHAEFKSVEVRHITTTETN